jgi:hypothetical protein
MSRRSLTYQARTSRGRVIPSFISLRSNVFENDSGFSFEGRFIRISNWYVDVNVIIVVLSAGPYGKECDEDEKWNYRVVPTTFS